MMCLDWYEHSIALAALALSVSAGVVVMDVTDVECHVIIGKKEDVTLKAS